MQTQTHRCSRGFTLLELLVSIAIIGLLASVIIFSISESKGKSADTAIKSAMTQAHNQAELYYNSNGRSYEGVCANDPFDKNTIGRFLVAAQNTYGGPVNEPYNDSVSGGFSPIVEICHDSVTDYVAWVPLKFQQNNAWCIDSRNISKKTTDVVFADEMNCP